MHLAPRHDWVSIAYYQVRMHANKIFLLFTALFSSSFLQLSIKPQSRYCQAIGIWTQVFPPQNNYWGSDRYIYSYAFISTIRNLALTSLWVRYTILHHTDCPLEELAETFEWETETDAKCNDSHSSLRIPYGVICINDTIPTYEVQYICDEHYTLFPEWQNSSRVCMTNRHWSGGHRTCEKEGELHDHVLNQKLIVTMYSMSHY